VVEELKEGEVTATRNERYFFSRRTSAPAVYLGDEELLLHNVRAEICWSYNPETVSAVRVSYEDTIQGRVSLPALMEYLQKSNISDMVERTRSL
jgi:hypothetical protein